MKACEHCSGSFTPKTQKQRFCSRLCVGRWAAQSRDMTGPRNPKYNGGFSEADGRTIVCTRDGGYVFWYRIVIEDVLGRPLREQEIVHHRNGDPTDDRLENLEVVTRAAHMEMHRDQLLAARGITRKVPA